MTEAAEIKYPNRLRQYREQLRITQEDLGNIIGVKKQTISKHESGTAKIFLEYQQWVRLRQALNLTESELLQLLDSSFANLPVEPFIKK